MEVLLLLHCLSSKVFLPKTITSINWKHGAVVNVSDLQFEDPMDCQTYVTLSSSSVMVLINVSRSKKLYPYCLVLVGSWNRFEQV